jgi:hypothetical protein
MADVETSRPGSIELERMEKELGLPRPSAPRIETIMVDLKADVAGLVRSLNDAIVSTVVGTRLEEKMEPVLLGRYMIHLLASRIRCTGGVVVGEKDEKISFNVLRFNHPGMLIPAVWQLVIDHVGCVVNHTFGLSLVPRLILPRGFEFLSQEELLSTWAWLARAREVGGLEVSNSFLREPTGDEEFMTFQVVNNVVCHHLADASTARAFLASFVVQGSLKSGLSQGSST